MSIIESANGVGARLAQARSEQGLSVEDLSSRTYIRPGVIRGIEDDDFAPCGGQFYARGHIRTLARALGVAEAPLLSEFDRQHGSPEPRIGPETTTAEPAGLRPAKVHSRNRGAGGKGRNGGPGWMAVATAVLIVICVVAIGSLIFGGSSKKDNATPASPAAPSAAPRPAPKAAAPAPRVYSGVNLAVRVANGDSWVRVVDENGKVLASSVGQQGMSSEFRGAQSLHVTFGNAAAVDATCNGKPLGPLGGQGAVVNRTIVLGDPACGPSTP